MVTWPTSLPDYVLAEGYQESAADNAIRSEMDVGPSKTRRRTTGAPIPIAARLRLTLAQRADLLAFFHTDTADGSLSFDWVHPVTRAAAAMRFLKPPVFTPAARGQRYYASLELEILP
jgi:hypothetical protein